MFQEIVLNSILLLFLLTCVWEDSLKTHKISLTSARKVINTISSKQLLFFISIPAALVILLLFAGYRNFLSLYIYTILSLLIIFHAWWLSTRLHNKVVLVFPIGIILARIFYPSILTHDIFVFLVVVWLGAEITSFTFFTRKIFVLINFIWLLYDIFYIWLTAGYHMVSTAAKTANFPLSIVVGHSSIGLADLLYAALLISIFRDLSYKYLSIIVLLIGDLFLAYYAYNIQFIQVFPLLVVWVPCGLLLLLAEHYHLKIKKKH